MHIAKGDLKMKLKVSSDWEDVTLILSTAFAGCRGRVHGCDPCGHAGGAEPADRVQKEQLFVGVDSGLFGKAASCTCL
jgi:hypothetical protein